MKNQIIIMLLLIRTSSTNAQTVEEWTDQKETQKKYLVEQIAALKVYTTYVEKGMAIAQKGLTAISNIKRGDWKLHQDYFNSLAAVNPNIKKYAEVSAIIALQLSMVEDYKRTYNQLKQSKKLSSEEINYYYAVATNLLDGCTDNLSELLMITTDGKAKMKDDERLKRIDSLYRDMQDKNTFLQSFDRDAKVLCLHIAKEQNDILSSKSIYGIK